MIVGRDISVVVQGAVDPNLTRPCLGSIRAILPGAEIILSTWTGSNTEELDYDVLVLSDDPGGIVCDKVHRITNNVNRQIVSTRSGIAAAKRRFTLKIRSDMLVTGTQFLDAWGRFDKDRSKDFLIFECRIVINNLYCANVRKTSFPLHISDWIQFGLTSDLLRLWNIPTQKKKDMSNYWTESRRPSIDPVPTWMGRYLPEQYILLSCLEQNGFPVPLRYHTDMTLQNESVSEIVFANNFIILDYENSGFRFAKYDPYKWDYSAQYTHYDWYRLYQKYCNPSSRPPFAIIAEGALKSTEFVRHKTRAIRYLKLIYSPIKYTIRWVRAPILLLFHLMMLSCTYVTHICVDLLWPRRMDG